MPQLSRSRNAGYAAPAMSTARPPAPHDDPRAAVSRLVDSHGPRLHALALRLCRHRADAEDLVQDVFLQAYRKWGTFRGRSDPGTWLYSIAARACKARARRKGGTDRRAPALSQLMPWKETTVMAAAAAPRVDEPARREAVERIQSALARLPEHLRLPTVLKEVLGLSVEDTARALGLATNTVKTRLHRARLALRKTMIARAPAVPAPDPIYEKQVCLDLLKAKMAAMDRGGAAAGFAVPQAEVCARCRAVFRELDLVQDACAQMASDQWTPRTRDAILRAIERRDAAEHAPRRGRRPVASK